VAVNTPDVYDCPDCDARLEVWVRLTRPPVRECAALPKGKRSRPMRKVGQ